MEKLNWLLEANNKFLYKMFNVLAQLEFADLQQQFSLILE